MHHRRFVLALPARRSSQPYPAAARRSAGARPTTRPWTSSTPRAIRRTSRSPQQPRHVAARLPAGRHVRRRRRGEVPAAQAHRRRLRQRASSKPCRWTSGPCAAPASPSASTSSPARSSPVSRAPPATASPPRRSTWAAAPPPTTRASTYRARSSLVDSSMDSFWFNFQGAEATKHGAVAVILTSNYSDATGMAYPSFPWYIVRPTRWAATTASTTWAWSPLIHLSPAGRRLAQGPDRRRHHRGHASSATWTSRWPRTAA